MAKEKTIYLAGGCFWGLEELVRQLPGVTDTEVGYTGGTTENPDYSNHLGYAEALAITYDTDKTTYKALLDFFFRAHDPSTLNRQGNDTGSSYRSAIFYQDETELAEAKEMIDLVDASGLYAGPAVTTLENFTKFYTAEDYHQDYLQHNPTGYTCHFIRTTKSLLS